MSRRKAVAAGEAARRRRKAQFAALPSVFDPASVPRFDVPVRLTVLDGGLAVNQSTNRQST